jgi:uroporphyrinogen-III decarboxylase
MLPSLMAPLMGYAAAGVVGALTIPPVAAALQALSTAAQEAARWSLAYNGFEAKMNELGFPSYAMTVALAPFDVISDMLRGMRGAMLDMYRRPDKLLAAQDKLLPFLVEATIVNAQMSGNPRVFIPLHRGADGFMSPKQFETFYWPGLKSLLLALIEAGLTPCPFFEGSYTQRLEYLRELPPGKILGLFDRTDLFKAKQIIGDVMCIAGDMPLSLLQTGTPEQIKSYSKNLIDVVGQGGGFIMSSNTVLDEADPELLRVWCDFTREYGVY